MLKKIVCAAVLAAFAMLALCACGNFAVVTLTGEMKELTETADAPASGITVVIRRMTFVDDGDVSIKIGYSETPRVRMRYQESLEYSGLYCRVSEDRIEVGTTAGGSFRADEFELEIYCDFDKIVLEGGYEIDVDAQNARELDVEVSGAVDIEIDGVAADRLKIAVSGAAAAELTGETSELSLDISGAGNVDAGRLACEDARIDASGACRVETSVSRSLDVDVSGLGVITYYGSPAVTKNVSGAGVVRQGSEDARAD